MADRKSYFGIPFRGYNYMDKERNVEDYVTYMMVRTLQMFDWMNLPETIPVVNIEKLLQSNGYCFFTQVNGEYYVFNGGLGGEPNVYNEPTKIVVSNPALQLNKEFNLETDGVLIRNDSLCQGLMPLLYRYCTMLNENDITMIMNDFVARSQVALSATDNATIASAERFLQKIARGEFGVIADDVFFTSLKSTPFSSSKQGSTFADLVQYAQYIRATMFNEIGLNANFNMKRESLTKNEVEMNSDNLYPLVDNMLHSRRQAIEKINAMYGLNISVEFSSSWDYRVLDGEELKLDTINEQLEAEKEESETGNESLPESSPESVDESSLESSHESNDESQNESLSESSHESIESDDETEDEAETPPEDAQSATEDGDDDSKGKGTAEDETPPEGKETGKEDDKEEEQT